MNQPTPPTATAKDEDILAWLDRTISEREAVAVAALNHGRGSAWRANGATVEIATAQAVYMDVFEETVVFNEGSPTEEQAAHIAANDPQSVLRRCAADRRMIGLMATETSETGGKPLASRLLRHLAEGYGWTEAPR
ncbi:DUF6221 family protein [Streptomyces microflavus]|uniref:DUF6221 family protein n=1 Tax=Streptomyces microflavus TaxID=1919 RepID=UPI0033C95FD3